MPGLPFPMPDKSEIAAIAPMAKGLGANEIDVMKISVIDDIAVAEHGPEALQDAVLGKHVFIQTLQRLEVIVVLGIFRMPDIQLVSTKIAFSWLSC